MAVRDRIDSSALKGPFDIQFKRRDSAGGASQVTDSFDVYVAAASAR